MAIVPPRAPRRGGVPKPPPGPEDALAKARREKDELEGECHRLEEELEELKAKYDQYFLGVERKEPVRQREELRKRVLRVKEAFTRNTGLKFRLQSLHARYLSYERLWLRSAREKEEGTYHRDLFKARLHRQKDERGTALAEPEEAAKPAPEKRPAPPGEAVKPGAPPAPSPAAAAQAPARRPAAPAAAAGRGGMVDADMRALYDAYVAAKKRCNEDVSRLTYEAVARTVSKQLPVLLERYKAKSVDFRVEVKDGKAILKAIPKV